MSAVGYASGKKVSQGSNGEGKEPAVTPPASAVAPAVRSAAGGQPEDSSESRNRRLSGHATRECFAREPTASDTPATRTSWTLAATPVGSRPLAVRRLFPLRFQWLGKAFFLRPRVACRTPPRSRRELPRSGTPPPADRDGGDADGSLIQPNATLALEFRSRINSPHLKSADSARE